MGLFNRKRKDAAVDGVEQTEVGKAKSKRPAATAFKQQRLKAWQPILTPRTVLPTLFILSLIFAPIGGVLIWGSNKVTEFTLDYTECDTMSSSLTNMPSSKFNYRLSSGHSSTAVTDPQWSYSTNSSGVAWEQNYCTIEFDVPYDLHSSVFLYYKLTNYYQNHRRYVQSLDPDQLHGKAQSTSTLNSGNCKPITTIDDKPVYPCGLIANSVFNDTFLQPTNVASSDVYNFTSNGITWPNEHKKYTDPGYASVSDVAVPPNWVVRYGTQYTEFPKLYNDPHFQVWMRTAGLPTFRKLYFRNDQDTMAAGRYSIQIYMNYPVKQFNGTKSIVISTVSWIGGKNSFLGWAYVAAAAIFALLGLAGTIRHLVKPRRLGDMSLLSWNQPKKQ